MQVACVCVWSCGPCCPSRLRSTALTYESSNAAVVVFALPSAVSVVTLSICLSLSSRWYDSVLVAASRLLLLLLMLLLDPCGIGGCENKAGFVSWREIVKGVPNQGLVCFVHYDSFVSVSLCFWCMWCCASLFLVVSTSAFDCLERLVTEVTYYVLSGMLNPTYSLTHS